MQLRKKYLLLLGLLFTIAATPIEAAIIDTVCVGQEGEVYFTIATPGTSYQWTVEGGNIVSDTDSSAVVVDWDTIPGIFDITLISANKQGCPGDTLIAQVWVVKEVEVRITGPAGLCLGDSITLTASGAEIYSWDDGGTGSTRSFKPNSNITLKVSGYIGYCLVDTTSYRVQVNPVPIADFTFSPDPPLLGDIVEFKDKSEGATRREWYIDSDSVTSVEKDPVHPFNDAGNKEVMLIAINEYGCSDTAIKVLKIDQDANIYIPTAFSPDGDGINDYFSIASTGLESLQVDIYNRWGQHIYSFTGVDGRWDGTHKGEPVPIGAYVYTLSASAVNKRKYYLNGSITVIK
ncbi:MAG: gliding motility-associated C-terminal domain-containing protein [Bacteroidia bacterium]